MPARIIRDTLIHGPKEGRGVHLRDRFETYKGDHPPLHVHIFKGSRFIGRWDIESQRPMDDFELGRDLRKALKRLGYLLEADE